MALSATIKAAMFAAETDQGLLVLLTISHASLGSPIRVVNNMQDVTSNGNTFTAYPFNIVLPDEPESSAPSATLEIDNVSQEIAQAVRTISSPATVLIQVIRMAAPNTIELEWPDFSLRNVKMDVMKVTGELVQENLTVEPYPAHNFTPGFFPGLLA